MLALGAALAFGLLLEFAVFRHLYDRDHLDQVIATFGIILFLNQGVKIVWGAAPLSLPMPGDVLRLGRADAAACSIRSGGSSSSAPGSRSRCMLYLLVSHTRVGMLVRAGATNAAMVSALGVNIRRLFMIVFGFGTMLAGFAGIMIAPILSVEPGMGDTILILAFVVIVIGGIGSIRGAFLAALIIGLVDTLGRSFAVDILRTVHGALAGAHRRARDRLDADLSADGAGAVLPPRRPVPREGALRWRTSPRRRRSRARAVRRQRAADRDLSRLRARAAVRRVHGPRPMCSASSRA